MTLGMIQYAYCCDVEPDDDERLSGGEGYFNAWHRRARKWVPTGNPNTATRNFMMKWWWDQHNPILPCEVSGPTPPGGSSWYWWESDTTYTRTARPFCYEQVKATPMADDAGYAAHYRGNTKILQEAPCTRWSYVYCYEGASPTEGGYISQEWTDPATESVTTNIGTSSVTFPKLVAGTLKSDPEVLDLDSVTGNPPVAYIIHWLPRATNDIPLLTVNLEAAALGDGPWEWRISGNFLVLVDRDGVRYEFQGSVAQVKTALAAAGGGTLFTTDDPTPGGTNGTLLSAAQAVLMSELPSQGGVVQDGCTSFTVMLLLKGQDFSWRNVAVEVPHRALPDSPDHDMTYWGANTLFGPGFFPMNTTLCTPTFGGSWPGSGTFGYIIPKSSLASYPNTRDGTLAWLRSDRYPIVVSLQPQCWCYDISNPNDGCDNWDSGWSQGAASVTGIPNTYDPMREVPFLPGPKNLSAGAGGLTASLIQGIDRGDVDDCPLRYDRFGRHSLQWTSNTPQASNQQVALFPSTGYMGSADSILAPSSWTNLSSNPDITSYNTTVSNDNGDWVGGSCRFLT